MTWTIQPLAALSEGCCPRSGDRLQPVDGWGHCEPCGLYWFSDTDTHARVPYPITVVGPQPNRDWPCPQAIANSRLAGPADEAQAYLRHALALLLVRWARHAFEERDAAGRSDAETGTKP